MFSFDLTHSTSPMKTSLRSFLLFLLVVTAFSACKKSTVDAVDVRAAYVGTYDPVQYQAVTYVGNFPSAPDQGRGTLTVEKGTGSNKEIFINITFPAYTEQLVGVLDGTKFTITNKTKEAITVLGRNLNGDYTGSGEFTTDNQIIINIVVQTTDSGTLVKKVGAFTGPKKQQ